MRRLDKWAKQHPGETAPASHLLLQVLAAASISASRRYIEAPGNEAGFNILLALRRCFAHGLTVPDWVARAFNERCDAVLHARVSSWSDEEAFGRPYPKGAQLARLRARREKGPAVAKQVLAGLERDKSQAIDATLFEAVGSQLGVGKTLAEDLWNEWRPFDWRLRVRANKGKAARSKPAKSKRVAGIKLRR